MARKKTITPVMFRKWPDGDIIALFPTELGTTSPYTCSSYMHIGQHGSADPNLVVWRTKPAKPAEYRELMKELHQIGYRNLKVVQKLQQGFLRERERKLAEMSRKGGKKR